MRPRARYALALAAEVGEFCASSLKDVANIGRPARCARSVGDLSHSSKGIPYGTNGIADYNIPKQTGHPFARSSALKQFKSSLEHPDPRNSHFKVASCCRNHSRSPHAPAHHPSISPIRPRTYRPVQAWAWNSMPAGKIADFDGLYPFRCIARAPWHQPDPHPARKYRCSL